MYDKQSSYVIAILVNGKVLREQSAEVYMAFDSEYTIRIKNPHCSRVGISVSIDGTDVTNGKVILSAFETFDLKRMILDGDLNTGPALKFVPLCHSDVQDPTDSANGLVQVDFYPEVVVQPTIWYDATPNKLDDTRLCSARSTLSSTATYGADISSIQCCANSVAPKATTSLTFIKLIKKLTKTDFPFSPIEITDDGEILLKNK